MSGAAARVAVGFGSNLGDREAHLQAGLVGLSRRWQLVGRSSLYESAPIGPIDQDPFLNAVAVFETDEPAGDVLRRMLSIEQAEGRVREVRWGPRTLDLDLLLYGRESVEIENLRVPHPELTKRRFVLDPLLEVWPDATLPDGNQLALFLSRVQDQAVERVGTWSLPWWLRLWWRVTGTGPRRNLAS